MRHWACCKCGDGIKRASPHEGVACQGYALECIDQERSECCTRQARLRQTRGQASLVLEDDDVEVVPAQQTEGSGSRVSRVSAQRSHSKGTAKRRAGSGLVMRQQVSGESQGERGLAQGQEPRQPSAPGDRHSGLQVKQGGARNCGEVHQSQCHQGPWCVGCGSSDQKVWCDGCNKVAYCSRERFGRPCYN